MNLVYEKDKKVVGVSDKYIYLEEVVECTPRSYRLADSRYISSKKPLILSKKQSYKKFPKENRSLRRLLTLLYAPEQYLIDEGYRKLKGAELFQYVEEN